jgi:hypothetical protein
MRENLRKPMKLNAQTTKPAKNNSMKTQYAKTNVKKSMMRSNAHTKIQPKGFPSGTPLVFLPFVTPDLANDFLFHTNSLP